MSESKKALLVLVLMITVTWAGFLWLGFDPPEVTTSTWIWRFCITATATASLVLLVWGMLRRDRAPDFLKQMFGKPYERDGLCFSFEPVVVEGFFSFRVWFQNRCEGRCKARIAIRPSRSFFLGKSKAEDVHIPVEVEPAGFGFVMVPFGIPAELQGKKQEFAVAASVDYPEGRKKMLRFRDGLRVGSISGGPEVALMAGALAAGMLVLHKAATLTLSLPTGVAPAVPAGLKPQAATLWRIGDSADVFASDGYVSAVERPSWGR